MREFATDADAINPMLCDYTVSCKYWKSIHRVLLQINLFFIHAAKHNEMSDTKSIQAVSFFLKDRPPSDKFCVSKESNSHKANVTSY